MDGWMGSFVISKDRFYSEGFKMIIGNALKLVKKLKFDQTPFFLFY